MRSPAFPGSHLQSCKISITSQFAKRKLSLRDAMPSSRSLCWVTESNSVYLNQELRVGSLEQSLRAKRHENISERCSSHCCCSSPSGSRAFAQAVPGMLSPFLTYEMARPPAAAYPVVWSILRLWAAPHDKHSIKVPPHVSPFHSTE